MSVIPVADPYPPQGEVLINGGARIASSRQVTLTLQADSDTTEVRLGSEIDEGTDEIGGPWRPFQSPLPWLIPVEIGPGETWTVFAQFRDAAGNESDVATDTIRRQPLLPWVYLPLLLRGS
jgi:hypothetical protein